MPSARNHAEIDTLTDVFDRALEKLADDWTSLRMGVAMSDTFMTMPGGGRP